MQDRPQVAAHFARHGYYGLRVNLARLAHAPEPGREPFLGAVGDRDHACRLAFASSAQRPAQRGPMSVVP